MAFSSILDHFTTYISKTFKPIFMKTKIVLLATIFFMVSALFAQNPLTFEKTTQPQNIKNKKFTKDFLAFIEKQQNFSITYSNKADTIIGKGSLVFTNQVKYPGSATIGRTYQNQSHGQISYNVEIVCLSNCYSVKLSGFTHKPSSTSENINFGIINDSDVAPNHLALDYDADWCNLVWKSIKDLVTNESNNFFRNIQADYTSSIK